MGLSKRNFDVFNSLKTSTYLANRPIFCYLPLMKTIQAKLQQLPEAPGIYLMKDTHGDILYVGKAKNLKNRVRSYFHHNPQHSKKVLRMVWNIADLDWQIVDTELDALLLECQLIQEHHPLYNRMMNSHLNYCYVKLTATGPVLITDLEPTDTSEVGGLPANISEESPLQTSLILGPFRQYKKLPTLIETLQDTYLLPGVNPLTSLAVQRQLPQMTQRPLSERLYQVNQFFLGNETTVFRELEARMTASAEQLNFENAAQLQQHLEQAQYFYRYVQEHQQFIAKKRLLWWTPLEKDPKQKKVYYISHGQLLTSRVIPLATPVSFDIAPLSAPPQLTKKDVDPQDILISYLKYH